MTFSRRPAAAAVRFAHVAFRTDEPAAALLARVRSAGLEHEVTVVPEENGVQIFVRLPGGLVVEPDADDAQGCTRSTAHAIPA